MTIDDAEHISAEQRQAIIDSYPPHEQEARIMGLPAMGSGRVFPIPESDITIAPFPIPDLWPCLCAFDFGWDHPTAGIKLAHDRDADCVYVTNAYRVRQQTPLIHAAAVKPWGRFPWSWPHDGLDTSGKQGTKPGTPFKDAYAEHGLLMLPQHSQFMDGSTGVEAGLMLILQRMQTGRFKVFAHLNDWFEEFRLYHRKDGILVKERDDLMSATRYGIMDLRFAGFEPRKATSEHRGGGAGSWMG